MAGFTRRYGSFPGTEVIQQIEGVIIVDAPPPGAVNGVATGVVACVGEFADMAGACVSDSSGAITTSIRPQEIFSGADLVAKVGGFDETLGEFGVSCGNGYVHLRNKQFSRLVCVPVNLCSARGIRLTRSLPVCKSATDTNPVVPVAGGTVSAGREFRNSTGRMRVGTRVEFTALDPIATGTGGSFGTGASAVTQTFVGGSNWDLISRPDGSLGARKGDIIVIGYNSGGAVTPTAEAGTYRVAADSTASTNLTIEKLDGSAFAVSIQATLPWRLHHSSDADSAPVRVPGSAAPGGYAAADAGGYVVPCRPLTTAAGTTVDGTWSASTALTPAVVPDALTGSSWDVLSGLSGRTHPSGTTAFTAALQGANAAASATLDAAYATAIDALLAEQAPSRDVNILIVARKSTTIATKQKAHVLEASQRGIGRCTIISPTLTTLTLSAAGADSAPGVGGNRNERVFYAWPGARHFVPEANGYRLRTSDGLTTVDGIMDDPTDSWLASVLSNLAPERNPGQSSAPVPQIMAPIQGMQRGCPDLGSPEYTFLRQKGVAALRIDRTVGPIFQSGITTSLTSGQKNIARRRFADFVQDSLAARLVQFSKEPLSNQLKDGAVAEIQAWCEEMQSPDNPAAQRIDAFEVDDKGGNRPELSARGIHVIIVRVRMTPTADFIVLQAEVGEGVTTSQAA